MYRIAICDDNEEILGIIKKKFNPIVNKTILE